MSAAPQPQQPWGQAVCEKLFADAFEAWKKGEEFYGFFEHGDDWARASVAFGIPDALYEPFASEDGHPEPEPLWFIEVKGTEPLVKQYRDQVLELTAIDRFEVLLDDRLPDYEAQLVSEGRWAETPGMVCGTMALRPGEKA